MFLVDQVVTRTNSVCKKMNKIIDAINSLTLPLKSCHQFKTVNKGLSRGKKSNVKFIEIEMVFIDRTLMLTVCLVSYCDVAVIMKSFPSVEQIL